MELTKQNHDKGFLVGEEWLGGVSVHARACARYVAFVVAHRTGEYILNQEFDDLDAALGVINALAMDWRFESASGGCGKDDGCGSGKCNSGGGCKNGGCGCSR